MIRLDNELVKETEEESESTILYNQIFNSLGEILQDTRLSTDQKIDILIKDNKIIPQGAKYTFPDGTSKGKFWNNCKSDKRCLNQPYKRLIEVSQIYREDWERYIKENEAKLSTDQKIDILIKDNKIFSTAAKDTFPDGTSKGRFWTDCKSDKRCSKESYNRLIEVSPIYREDWERYIKENEAKKDIIKVSIEEKIDILIEDKKIFSKRAKDTFPDGTSKGKFWDNCKTRKKFLKQPYKRLIDESPVYREDWERYINRT